MSRIVVYTAITQGYDTLKSPPDLWQKKADFVAFLDDVQPCQGWEIRQIKKEFEDPCRNAKIYKMLPHRYFPESQYSLWIDGSVIIKSSTGPEHLVDLYLAQHDLAVFRHRRRNCIYQEAAACLRLGKDLPSTIRNQIQQYRAEGYPSNNGLAECTVLLRRHTDQMKQFNELWHSEILAHSRRDQLSFKYIATKFGFKYRYFQGNISRNPYFDWGPHLRS
jgi:hypothetical protein